MISYEPFWETVREKGISTYVLYTRYKLSRSELDRLRHNRNLEIRTLDRLCNILECEPHDIFRYTRDADFNWQASNHGKRNRKKVKETPES